MKFKIKYPLAAFIVALNITSAIAQDNVLEYIKEYPRQEQFKIMNTWLGNNKIGTISFTGLVDPEAKKANVQASVDYGYTWFSISDSPAIVTVPKYDKFFSISLYDMKHNVPGVIVNPTKPILLVRPGQKVPKGEFNIVELETDQGLIITRMVVANNLSEVKQLRASIKMEGGKADINYKVKKFSANTIKWGNSLIEASLKYVKAVYPKKSGEVDPITLAAVVKRARHGAPSDAVKYSVIVTDGNGQPLNGNDTYELTVPANIVRKGGYMSITVYGIDNKSLIPNEKKIYDRTSYSSIQNKNGTYTITLSPTGEGLNGIPTGKPFYAILRAYAPIEGADLKVIVNKK